MAGSSAYQYKSDNGMLYQVLMPDDFAAALGCVPAVGTEPYLPQWLTPRYASYVASNPAVFRQPLIPTLAIFGNLPSVLRVGGQNYSVGGAQSESTFSQYGGNLILAAGPQGEQGPQGVPSTSVNGSTVLGADVAVTSAGGTAQILSTALTAGTWLVVARVTYQNNASTLTLTCSLQDFSAGGFLQGTGSQRVNASDWGVMAVSQILTLVSTHNIGVGVLLSTASGTIKYRDFNLNGGATRLDAVKLN